MATRTATTARHKTLPATMSLSPHQSHDVMLAFIMNINAAEEARLSQPDKPLDDPDRMATTSQGANCQAIQRILSVRNHCCNYPQSFPHVSARTTEDIPTTTFWEAQRTNWIEGSRIYPSDAWAHLQTGEPVYQETEPADNSTDIVNAYHLISADRHDSRPWPDVTSFLDHLQRTHAQWFRHRPNDLPGIWKPVENHIESRYFTPPPQVVNTLRAAWDIARSMPPGEPRAAVIEYAIVEIHPFLDGNGRLSRFMANHELSCHGAQRLITPEPFWEQYQGGLWDLIHSETFTGQPNPVRWLNIRQAARQDNRCQEQWVKQMSRTSPAIYP